MNLFDLYPELNFEFDSRLIQSSLLTEAADFEVSKFLESIVKTDLVAPLQTIIRELIQNSIKANLKRYLFETTDIDANNRSQYETGMNIFHTALRYFVREGYSKIIEDQQLFFQIFLSSHRRVSIIHVVNSGKLFKEEEQRIRHKFARARLTRGLYQFYLDDSDLVEGSGMGIALNEIILRQIGLNGRYFSIFSNDQYNVTIARLIIPHHEDYKTPRQRFDQLLHQSKIDASTLRHQLQESPLKFLDT